MDGFTKLGPAIWLREPSPSPPPSASPAPSLIILCTWVGAQPRHITKYTTSYLHRYPTTTLLVLESGLADMTYRTDTTQQTRLLPARHVLQAHLQPPPTTGGGIVLHAFSNGGAQSATQLLAATPPRLHALILDSTPSSVHYTRSLAAILVPLAKSPLLKLLALPFIHLLLCVIFLCDRVLGFENVVARARRRLNSSAFVGLEVPRLYLYSDADEMVGAEDVETHAEEARRAGYGGVEMLRFEGSGHCAHALRYGERYWEGVAGVLERSNAVARG
ncbi:hypothetical protein VE03_09968 [Pseudogymnoascus sp. 23342-1-I1]|nr:hypothetical protein VE03_09968 [Pseudogymnoascus sp. 23342-1-I1]